jgi:hypothetical protein
MTKSPQPRRQKLARVTYDEYDGEIHVGKTGSFGWDQVGEAFGSLEAVGSASLTQLRDALKRAGRTSFAVSTDSAEHFDPEFASSNDTTFEFKSGKLLTKIEGWLGGHGDDESDALERLILHYLRERRSNVEFFEVYTYSADTHASLTYASPYYTRSVREIAALAHDAKALLSAAVTGSVTPSSGLALILGGHAEAFVGLYESAWLEAKRAPYELADDAQGLELALDVAALANSESGGLLVVGLATKKDGDGDRITKVTPTKVELISRRKHRQLLDRLVYPAIAGLELHAVSHGSEGLGLLVIEVPAQPEQLKPFLVSGTLIRGKVRGGYFTLVTRRGDARMATSPAEIHGLLTAGRLATRLNPRKGKG